MLLLYYLSLFFSATADKWYVNQETLCWNQILLQFTNKIHREQAMCVV